MHQVGCDECRGNVLDVSARVDHYVAAMNATKPLWIIPQAFGGSEHWDRQPSAPEERVMTYLSVWPNGCGPLCASSSTAPRASSTSLSPSLRQSFGSSASNSPSRCNSSFAFRQFFNNGSVTPFIPAIASPQSRRRAPMPRLGRRQTLAPTLSPPWRTPQLQRRTCKCG